jgi:hypothetical protein
VPAGVVTSVGKRHTDDRNHCDRSAIRRSTNHFDAPAVSAYPIFRWCDIYFRHSFHRLPSWKRGTPNDPIERFIRA